MTGSQTVLLRHFDFPGTKGTWEHKQLRHSCHSRHSDTWRAFGHSNTQGTSTLGHLRYLKGAQGTWKELKALWRLLGHLDTWDTQRALRHSDTSALGHAGKWVPGHSKDTQTLKHLGTGGTQGTLFGKPLLDVSRASTIALAGIHAGDYDHPYLYFSQAPGQFLPCYSFCFVHLGIFHNIGWSAIRLLLPVLEVACSLLIIKLMVRLYFWIFSGFLWTNFLSVDLIWNILH